MFDVIKWNMLSFLTLKRVKNEFSCVFTLTALSSYVYIYLTLFTAMIQVAFVDNERSQE